jgi:putative ABC transport system ATP-binding protein
LIYLDKKGFMGSVLSSNNLTKTFQTGTRSITVLHDISFEIAKNTSISIVGPSGSGKTTLLGLCAGLDQPTSGSIRLLDIELGELSEDERAYVRNQYVGFVFQNFQLLPTLTALENVMIPLELRGGKNITVKAEELLGRVGLADRMNHYPSQLSGGEQQRVAIARAFISEPKILFADEPTGNLDEETADKITDLLFAINKELGTTLVLVTHNLQLAAHTGRILKLKGGKILQDKTIIA